jgi:hypothetical protein
VNAPAGVLNTVNWNNLTGLSQTTPQLLTVDLNSGSVASTATVVWNSIGLWSSTGRGEENNFAQDTATNANADLMAGYLDTGGVGETGVMINVTGLNAAGFTLGYDVYVYIQGGVNNRGGTYTLGNVIDSHDVLAGFDGTFIEDTDLAGTTPGSNYIVFRNVTGDNFILNTTATIGNPARAPVNAIEIRAAIPEPSCLLALAGGTGLLLGLRRRTKP